MEKRTEKKRKKNALQNAMRCTNDDDDDDDDSHIWKGKSEKWAQMIGIFIRYPIVPRDMFMYFHALALALALAHTFLLLFRFLRVCAVPSRHNRIGSVEWMCSLLAARTASLQPNIVKTRFVSKFLCATELCGSCKHTTSAVSSRSSDSKNNIFEKQICFAGNYDNSCLVQFPSLPFFFVVFITDAAAIMYAPNAIFQRIISEASARRLAIYSFL